MWCRLDPNKERGSDGLTNRLVDVLYECIVWYVVCYVTEGRREEREKQQEQHLRSSSLLLLFYSFERKPDLSLNPLTQVSADTRNTG